MKITYINLMGKDYPLCWNLEVGAKLQEQYGDIDSLMEALRGESIRAMINTLDALLEGGQNYCKVAGIECPPPLPCSVGSVIDISDTSAVAEAFKAINAGSEREVEVVEKNAAATPEE